MSKTPKTSSTPLPWKLPVLTDTEIFAVKALADGLADGHQQRIAWAFIREKLCACETMTFWPGGEDGRRATDFAEGKRWVAGQLRRIHRLTPATVNAHDDPPPMPAVQDPTDTKQ